MLKVTPNGQNAKLGPGVGTTYRPVELTCPNDCPLLGAGCYAQRGHVAIQAKRSASDNHDLQKLMANTLVRHLVSGDWLKATKNGRKVLDRFFFRAVVALHRRCPWLTGWGYTHAPKAFKAAKIDPKALPVNLHILASCHTAEEKSALNADGWRTARVINETEDRQTDEFLCPVDAQKRKGVPADKRTNCSRCRACFDGKGRNIAFLRF